MIGTSRSGLSELGAGQQLIAVILDVHPLHFKQPWTLENLVPSLLTFLNALRAQQEDVEVCLLLSHHDSAFASQLWNTRTQTHEGFNSGQYRPFAHIQQDLYAGLQRFFDQPTPENFAASGIVRALAQALCYINKRTRTQTANITNRLHSRIIIVSSSPDATQKYIPFMNCCFAAQRASIPIDICFLESTAGAKQKKTSTNMFLQQAAHITAGMFIRVENPAELLQTLMSCMTPLARSTRGLLKLKYAEEVDLRSTCFCHRRVVDTGYVCSICLSSNLTSYCVRATNCCVVFCEGNLDVCPMCDSPFKSKNKASAASS